MHMYSLQHTTAVVVVLYIGGWATDYDDGENSLASQPDPL